MQREITSIRDRKAQEAGARSRLQQMGRYTVEPKQCNKFIGYWTRGECRIIQSLNPGPVQPNEGQLRGGGSLR